MKKTREPYPCPKCSNTSAQEGISFAYLEWRIYPVNGIIDGDGIVDYDNGDPVGPDARDELTAKNIPNDAPDLTHFHCNKCDWNWAGGYR